MTTEKLFVQTGVESVNMSSVKDQLLQNFKESKDYRHAFVEEKVRTGLAVQIKAIREQQTLTQPALAQLMGKAQSWVSRLEDPNQPPPTISSLLQVAEAFDVDLNIHFGSFSELLDHLNNMTPESFRVPAFEEELPDLEKEAAALTAQEALRLAELAFPENVEELGKETSVTSIMDFISEQGRRQPAAVVSAIIEQRTLENQPGTDLVERLEQIHIKREKGKTSGNRQSPHGQSGAARVSFDVGAPVFGVNVSSSAIEVRVSDATSASKSRTPPPKHHACGVLV